MVEPLGVAQALEAAAAVEVAAPEAQDAEALRLVLVAVGLRRVSKRALLALRARVQVVAEPPEAVAVVVVPHAGNGVAAAALAAAFVMRGRVPLRPKSAVASVLRQRAWVRTS